MRFPILLTLAALSLSCGGDTGTNTPPVATLVIIGDDHVKVGDDYQLSVEARTANGTIVQRPVTWSVVEAGKGTISAAGVFRPLETGEITVRAVVEGITANGGVTGYDWVEARSTGVQGLALEADIYVTNKLAQAEYPTLVLGCVDGTFVVGVVTELFETASGNVSYSFNSGTAINDVWLESDDFSSLTYPGATNLSQKNFASQLASSSRFNFTFTEFQSTAKQTRFRVGGMAPLLALAFNACPSNALRAEAIDAEGYGQLVKRLHEGIADPRPAGPRL